MKKAFSTLSVMELTQAQVGELIYRLGFDAVEIRLDGDGTAGGIGEDGAELLKTIYRDAGILSLNSGVTLTPGTEDTPDLDRAVSFASSIGAAGVRVFADPGVNRDLNALAAVVALKAAEADKKGVRLLIETHGALCSSRDLRRLYDLTGGAFRVIWDVLHTLESRESIEDSANNLSGIISHVHLKDAKIEAGKYVMTRLGDGDVDPKAVKSVLEKIGFSGALSLEWEGFWHRELRTIYSTPEELLRNYLYWIE